MATVALREWTSAIPENCPELADRRLAPGGDAQRHAKDLTESGRLIIRELAGGLSLQATSWVGRLTLDDLIITIRPKLPALPLVSLLRYAYGLRDLHLLGAARYASETGAFQDLLIAQLIDEVTELIARGLHRDYRRTAEVLDQPRGRLDLRAYAAGDGQARAALPCVHHPRSCDEPLNQTLLAGLHLALGATRDGELRMRLHRLADRLDDALSGGTRTRAGLDHVMLGRAHRSLDRHTAHYRPALTLLGLLLDGLSMSFQDTRPEHHFNGLLFDMNAFFQALLSRFLRAHLVDAQLLDEHRLRGAFAYDPAHNPRNRRDPAPRPDFAVVQEGCVIALLDAKYRDLWEQSLPREMLYQLAIYALTQADEQPVSIILYPTMSHDAVDQVVSFRGVLSGAAKARVILRPVYLLRLEELLRAGSGIDAERQRRGMVAGLIRRGASGADTSPVLAFG